MGIHLAISIPDKSILTVFQLTQDNLLILVVYHVRLWR